MSNEEIRRRVQKSIDAFNKGVKRPEEKYNLIRTTNVEWDVSFYWNNFEEAFENWFAGEVLEVFFQGKWQIWDESNRNLIMR